MERTEPDLLSDIQKFVDQIPFAKEIGLIVAQAKKGFVSLKLCPQIRLFNHFKTYQAGALFTLAEVTGGALCGTFMDLSKNLVLTKRGEINFKQAANSEVFSEAFLEEKTINEVLLNLEVFKKMDLPIEIRLKTLEGQILAYCRLCYYLRYRIPRSFALSVRQNEVN